MHATLPCETSRNRHAQEQRERTVTQNQTAMQDSFTDKGPRRGLTVIAV